ncbi:hypothetical protein KIW84_023039 [Lathyrus oleraceus]|uniref:Uncharacterized protein n=1 Tax=Pisum sativum TaxID=3888 RepID=A0A9D4YD64_PEA|nr:hypothetical protein KIW84_023039 [Pisum sativum]
MHKDDCLVNDDVNVIVPIFKQPEKLVIQYNSSNNNSQRLVSPLVIRLAGPVPYSSYKVVPYQYNATMMKDGQEVPLPTTSSVVSIADVTKVTRSGRVFGSVFPKDKEESVKSKNVEMHVEDSVGYSKEKRQRSGERAKRKSKRTKVGEEKSLKLKDCRINSDDVKTVIESVFGLVVIFRTYSFLRSRNRRSESPPTVENTENSASVSLLAQGQLSVLR